MDNNVMKIGTNTKIKLAEKKVENKLIKEKNIKGTIVIDSIIIRINFRNIPLLPSLTFSIRSGSPL